MANIQPELMTKYNEWRASQGLPLVSQYTGPKRPRTVTMTDEAYNDLRRLAVKFGHLSTKGRPSDFPQEVPGAGVGEFLEALAGGQYTIEPNV